MNALSTKGYQAFYRTVEPYGLVSMNKAFVYSLVFHGALIILGVVGLPYASHDPLVIATPVSVELVDIDEFTRTTNKAPPKPKPEKAESMPAPPKPSVPQMTQDAPPDMAKPKAPELKEAKEAPKPVPPPPKPEAKKKPEEKKPEPKEETNDPQVKEEGADSAKSFESLLRNLTPEDATPSSESEAKDLNQGEGNPLSQIAPLGERMSVSEQDALRQQLARCWNVMAGAKYAENLVVEVRAVINPDRTLQTATIVDQSRYNRDSHFRAAADAALRALRNPACSPLELPPNKYEQWKNTVIRFDPREML